MIKHIGYIDREFGYVDKHYVGGDMGWSFSDLSDTFSEDIEELLAGSREYCFGDAAVRGDDVMDEDGVFAIYSVCEADIELEDATSPLWSGAIVEGTQKVIEVHVCATKEEAGWLEENLSYNGKTIKYRD